MSFVPFIMFYILMCHINVINSRTSTLWKLNTEEGKIIEMPNFPHIVNIHGFNTEEDFIFDIITSTHHFGNVWAKHSLTDCYNTTEWKTNLPDEHLDCGRPVNFTYYDNLVGVANRFNHPHVPEPQIQMIFNKRNVKGDYDVNALERRLRKAKRDKPKSVQLYNQIGNFWRVKGDAQKSIECFRRALSVSPHNAEVLLNLARVLFNLQYLDDAIYLTRRSLEVQPPDKNAWQQYFTLGEIFKAYGHYQEASLHLRHCLELRPDFQPALTVLHEMEALPDATIHIYTLLIIICLVLGVLLVILSSVEGSLEEEYNKALKQRHFNRSLAIRRVKRDHAYLR